MDVTTYPCWDLSESISVKMAPGYMNYHNKDKSHWANTRHLSVTDLSLYEMFRFNPLGSAEDI